MHFRLRTLLIVLAVAPVVLAGAWVKYSAWRAERAATLTPYIDPYDSNLCVEGRDFTNFKEPTGPEQTAVESRYDGIPFEMRLPEGWTWRDDVARASNLYQSDPPTPVLVLPLDGSRYASMRFDSDEYSDDDTPWGAAEKHLAELSSESTRKVREARVIDVDGVPAAWQVTEGTQSLEALCVVRVKDVDLKLEFSFHDSRKRHTPADLDQAQADFNNIVHSIRWKSPDETDQLRPL